MITGRKKNSKGTFINDTAIGISNAKSLRIRHFRKIRFQVNKKLSQAIVEGDIQSFDELFIHVDQRTLFKDAGLNPYGPGRKRVDDPRIFTIVEVDQLATFIGVPGLKLLEMIDHDIGEWVKIIYNSSWP